MNHSKEDAVILRASNVCKNFGATKALKDFSLEIKRGEIHGLIGENGSGKSTFSSIISGAQREDKGEFIYLDKEYIPKDMSYAQSKGICMVAQEAGTFSGITVAFNVFAGNLGKFTKYGLLNERKLNAEATRILKEIGAENIFAQQAIDALNFEEKKIVEIARAMYFEPELLIIDETTTALAQKGRSILYKLMDKQKNEGKAVLFISHDLDELKAVCNIITIMRDGEYIATLSGDEITSDSMRKLMVGREMADHYFREDYDGSYDEEVVIEARRVTLNSAIQNLDIQIHKGEILGFGGLANSGMHEVGRAFAGIEKTITGEVVMPEKGIHITNSVVAVKSGIGYVSKDRDKEALIQNASIRDNIEMVSYDQIAKGGIIVSRKEKELAEEQIDKLRIKCVSDIQYVQELSGGNKQKVVFAKWIAKKCDVLVLDCPTRGIDVGVKADMYDLIYALKKEGKAILFISEELPELLGMSDRMLFFKDGRITAEVKRSKDLTEHDVIEYMI